LQNPEPKEEKHFVSWWRTRKTIPVHSLQVVFRGILLGNTDYVARKVLSPYFWRCLSPGEM
jgi:hypothetical protein